MIYQLAYGINPLSALTDNVLRVAIAHNIETYIRGKSVSSGWVRDDGVFVLASQQSFPDYTPVTEIESTARNLVDGCYFTAVIEHDRCRGEWSCFVYERSALGEIECHTFRSYAEAKRWTEDTLRELADNCEVSHPCPRGWGSVEA
jgi:hypothetical protein